MSASKDMHCAVCGRRCLRAGWTAQWILQWCAGTSLPVQTEWALRGQTECELWASRPSPAVPGSFKKLVELSGPRTGAPVVWLMADAEALAADAIFRLEKSLMRLRTSYEHAARGGALPNLGELAAAPSKQPPNDENLLREAESVASCAMSLAGAWRETSASIAERFEDLEVRALQLAQQVAVASVGPQPTERLIAGVPTRMSVTL